MVFHNWKDSFELPHESNWSLYQKKCFLNGYTVKSLPYLHSSINHAKDITFGESFSSPLRYCPICAKYGYHAWFHQLQFLDKCLIHSNQALLHTDFSTHTIQEQSFFEVLQTRIIDTIVNDELRQAIEKHIQFDFDCIYAIDPMEYKWGAQRTFRSRWYSNTIQTLKACFNREPFSMARKVAVLTPDTEKEIISWAEVYLEKSAVPHAIARMQETKPDAHTLEQDKTYDEYIKRKWYNLRSVDPIEPHIKLILHRYFRSICERVGGEAQFEAILQSIHRYEFDPALCDYITYAQTIALILSAHYSSPAHLELLYQDVRHLCKIPRHSSQLNFPWIDFSQNIIIKKTLDEGMKLSILPAILSDLFSYTASILARLMEEKKCLTGGEITNIYSSFFCLPVSQYIAVCRNDTVELWACDPKVDGLIKNICHSYAYHIKNGRLEESPHLEAV